MANVIITINEAGVRQLLEGPSGSVQAKLRDVATDVAAACRREAPVVTGKLRDSIVVRPGATTSRVGWSVVADTDYSLAVEKGTQPHVIVPRRASVLRFPTKTGVVYTTKVNHPGTKANPFMEKALRSVPLG
jgi:HK97 gp10 family phage protein